MFRFYLINLYYSVVAQYLWARHGAPDDFSLGEWLPERVGTSVGLRADWFTQLTPDGYHPTIHGCPFCGYCEPLPGAGPCPGCYFAIDDSIEPF